ncbi:ubiquitin carboxyl-terminal hydrolase 47 isoform X3 [Triplophysa rosa]|uniref:ubiquitin carboxyl-terminal hydrolase 47 isoform X3 n=1 Tax=Triplophysa rosa TaxID=992332 RepID=UPI002545F24E|nr:ubiquitin carboxyl-terminal hydrolase 47 isoform X3 [Triplophysa rosa]
MTQEFRDSVESYDKAPEDCGEDLLRQLQKLFKQLSVNVATTKGITTSLGIGNVYEQQDAVEYYRKILKAVGRRVSEVFEGKMNNITKCISCDNINKKTSSFISILLPIEDENNEQHTVEKSLKAFFKRLRLDQDDWMYCDRCDQKTPTETWSEIDEYPTVLTFHLKRFAFDYNQIRYVKNSCALDVPLSLDIKNQTFNLYAVINHNGGYSGGHYDALIKSDQNQKWYSFDDRTVTESETSLQGSRLPYMLMYRKAENQLKDKNPIGSNPAIHLRILLLGPPGTEKSSMGSEIPSPPDVPHARNHLSHPMSSGNIENPKDVHAFIHRVKVVEDLLAVFVDSNIIKSTLKMDFVNESAVDDAGVSREVYTAFWDQFLEQCEGEDERIPRLRPDFSEVEWEAVGRIWVKGLLDLGVLPIRLSSAFILACMHGIDSRSATMS